MKFLLTSAVSIIAVVAVAAGCRTTNPAATGGESGLSEVSVPVPAEVLKNLGENGKAVLYTNDDQRQFPAPIQYKRGGGSATVTFSSDLQGSKMQRDQKLTSIRIALLDAAGDAIYAANGEPTELTLGFGDNKVSFNLKCANSQAAKLKCNSNKDFTVTGLQGPAGQTAASVVADLSIDQQGITFEQRKAKLVQCMQAFEGNGQIDCDNYRGSANGFETCKKLTQFRASLGVNTSLAKFVNDASSVSVLDEYEGYCDKLGLIQYK